MFFWAFIVPYCEARLQHYDSIDLGLCDEKNCSPPLRQSRHCANFLPTWWRKSIPTYWRRSGSGPTPRSARNDFYARRWILGPPPERQRFYLIRKPIRFQIQPINQALGGAPKIGLHHYLDRLNVRSDDPVDVSDCFDDPRRMQRWQHKTRGVLTEMAGFLRWLDDWLRAHPGMAPVPLLHGTLLIHVGLTWLGRRPLPVFLSRAFANTWSDNRPIHEALADVVYGVLLEQGDGSLATMRRRFVEHLRRHPGVVPAPFMRACRAQLASL